MSAKAIDNPSKPSWIGVLLFALCACVMPTGHALDRSAGSGAVSVLSPGHYHGDEVRYASGPGWFALLVSGGRARLEPVDLKIRWVHDPLLDGDDKSKGPYTGKAVAAVPRTSAAVLLKGPMLRAGDVDVAAVLHGQQAGVSPKTYGLGKRQYALAMSEGCAGSSDPCAWVLSSGGVRQSLHELHVARTAENAFDTESGNTGVMFAGDLDRDGKLDLILDVSNHGNAVRQIRVYLSSAAMKGELVRLVGSFSAVGC